MRDYRLKKLRKGIRRMTLSPGMEGKLLVSSEMAVRLVLQKTLASIASLTGDEVFLDPDQMDRLEAHFSGQSNSPSGDAYLAWRWVIQGARLEDARDMGHFLAVAELAFKALVGAPTPNGKGKAPP